MRTKQKWLVLAVAALGQFGCLGNWSNEDLQYFNALPTKATLEAALAGHASSALSGVGTKKQGLGNGPLHVGDHSEAFDSVNGAVTDLNAVINVVVNVVEIVQLFPPTQRLLTSRIWGPFNDDSRPGCQVRVTISKIDQSHFDYVFEERCMTNGPFTTTVHGMVEATSDLHRGKGSIEIMGANIRSLFNSQDFAPSDKITIDYDNHSNPTAVETQAFIDGSTPDSGSAFAVDYQQLDGGGGRIQFVSAGDDPVAGHTTIDENGYWVQSGSGRVDAKVTTGLFTGATGIECWDTSENVSYQRFWDGTENGDAGSCVAPPF